MKKIVISCMLAALAVPAYAMDFGDISGRVGLGYQASAVDTQYGKCWQECFGSQEPVGFAVDARVNFGPLFVGLDVAALSEDEDSYGSKVSNKWNSQSFNVGFSHALNSYANVEAALVYTSVDWEYRWRNSSGDVWKYEAEDTGVSLALGGDVAVNERMTTGASLSLGFVQGIDVYAQYALTQNLGLRVSYSKHAYELGDFDYTFNGAPSGSPNDDDDKDYQVNTQMLRLSLQFSF